MYFPENKAKTGPWIFNWKITKSESLAWHGWCWFLISDFLKLRHGAYGFNDLFEKYLVGASYHFISCGMRHIVSYSEPGCLRRRTFFSEMVGFSRKNVLIQDELIAISAEVDLTTWRPKPLEFSYLMGRKETQESKKKGGGMNLTSDSCFSKRQ